MSVRRNRPEVAGSGATAHIAESREPAGNTEFTQLRGDGSRHPDRRAGRPAIQRLPRAQNSRAGGQEQLRQNQPSYDFEGSSPYTILILLGKSSFNKQSNFSKFPMG